MKFTKYDRLTMCLLFVLMFLITGAPYLFLKAVTTVDELGTLASAAYLSGRNWHVGIVSCGGYYYKYGQTLLWALPFLLFRDALTIFRTIGAIDAFCMGFVPVMAYVICRRYLRVERVPQAAVMAAAAAMISDTVFQSVFLRGDHMLVVMNWACALTLPAAMNAEDKKKKALYSFLLSFFAVYAFACHSRGIVVVIAVALTVILLRLFMREKAVSLPVYVIGTAVFLFADSRLQRYFRDAIWQGRQAHAVGIPAESLEHLFSPAGAVDFLKMTIGWLYNAFATTGGLAVVALAGCILIGGHILKKSGMVSKEEGALAAFGALTFLGSLALGIIFFLDMAKDNLSGESIVRTDRIIYDRYICSAYGILCLLAVYLLIRRRDLFGVRARIGACAGSALLVALFSVWIAPILNNADFVKRYVGVLCTFLPIQKEINASFHAENVSAGMTAIGAVMLLVMALYLFLAGTKRAESLCVISVCIGFALYVFNIKYMMFSEAGRVGYKMEYSSELIESFGDLYEEYPVVWRGRYTGHLKSYQVRLMNYEIAGTAYCPFEKLDNILVIYSKLPDQNSMSPGTYYTIDGAVYGERIRDVVLVKGTKLKEELESRGFSLTLYAQRE